ncbi:ArnT family glycosyltransferase [Terrimonas pollutisoli]|uniref:ArnT family glycosyltransferase n=1 Tax=Terrimonas pollutisoli TaxID=3034147 RepID=UPI0023ECD738|nr:glycosyltransferase family 39 protein [Terrimonas sp. H1YJ31]
MHSKSFLLVILLAAFLLFIKLGATTVFQVAEARNTRVSAEMIERKDYIVPFFNGELRTDKPPLHYYAMLLAYRLGGINETSARFFSAVCGLFIIVATWLFAKRNAGTGVALWSCLVLLASVHGIFQFRLATPDPYLIACHVLSLFCFWEGFKNYKRSFLWLMYFFLGLAILAKGPVGLVLPAITIFLFLLLKREFPVSAIWKLKPLQGLIIIMAVALPWFYLVHVKTDGIWTHGFFFEHNIGRFNDPFDGHKGPFILTWGFVIMGLFPFSIFLIRAIAMAWKKRATNAWLFFNLVAAMVIILAYSVSATKLLNYTTPAYPFLALVIGSFIFSTIESKETVKKLWPEWIILLLIALVLPAGFYFWAQSEKFMTSIAWMSILLSVLPLAVVAGVIYYKKMYIGKSFYLTASGGILVNILFFSILFPALDANGSVHQLKDRVKPGMAVIAYRKFNDAFTFYHQKNIPVISSTNTIVEFLKYNPNALIVERASAPHLMDSVQGLIIKESAKDLFSRQYSFIYELKK